MFSEEVSAITLLEAFEQRTKLFPSSTPWCVELGPKNAPFTLAIGSAIHGNETGSIPGIISMIDDLCEDNDHLNARYLFFIGNPDAVKAGSRFIERDLNRCFELKDNKTLEGKRSIELARALETANLFIDYHQTNQPTVFPFFTFAYHEESYRWASHMNATEHFVTRDMKIAFSSEGLCGDEWVRKNGKAAVTLELGRAGLSHYAYRVTLSSLQRVIGFIETELDHGRIPSPKQPPAEFDLTFYEVAAKITWPGDEAALIPNLQNFQAVEANEELGIARPGVKIVSPVSGYLLFPKYPKRGTDGKPLEAQGGDIVQVVRPLTQHPRLLWK